MTHSRISLREKICYGLGDVTGNGMFTLLSSYLLFFCTDVLGLSLSATAAILFVERLVDAVFCPVMGSLLDYFQFKSGKCLPFLRVFLIPFGICLYLLFSPPAAFTGTPLLGYMLTMSFFHSVLFAVINIAYSTLLSVLTHDADERLSLNVFKNLGANLGGFLATSLMLPLVSMTASDQRTGFSRASLIFAVLFIICGLANAWTQKERVVLEKRERILLKDSLSIALKNKGWCILCVVQFCSLAFMTMRTQGITYYAKYILLDEEFGSVLLTIISVVGLIMAFLMPSIARKLGGKNCVILGNGLFCLSVIANAFAGENLPLILLSNVGSNIGWNLAMGIVFVMISDTIDESERQSGKRIDGLMMSVMIFLQKLGQAAAGVLTAWILEWYGYEANTAITARAMQGIMISFIWVPALFSAVIILLMLFFPSNRKK